MNISVFYGIAHVAQHNLQNYELMFGTNGSRNVPINLNKAGHNVPVKNFSKNFSDVGSRIFLACNKSLISLRIINFDAHKPLILCL